MQFDCSRKTLVAAVLMTLIIGMAATPLVGDIDGTAPEGQTKVTDMGQIWSMSAMFIFNGGDATAITWDFGDGTPVSHEFDVKHTFAEKGIYNVTQTVQNSKGTASEVYKIEIMGYPYVEFDSMGGSAVEKIQMGAVNQSAVKPADPTKLNAKFCGWYVDRQCSVEYDWNQAVTEPVKLYAKWESQMTDYTDLGPFYSYTVGFNYSGVGASTVEWDFGDGTTDTGMIVSHTFQSKGVFYVKQTATNDLGVSEAYYKVEILGFPVITFVSNGGSSVDPIQLSNWDVVAQKPADPTKTNANFIGWYKDAGLNRPMNWDVSITESMTLYAKWNETGIKHTVSFDYAGGVGGLIDDVQVTHGNEYSLPDYTGVKDHYVFKEWTDGVANYQAGQVVRIDSDKTFTAVWTPATYKVTFSDGISSQNIAYNETAKKPVDPIKEGYTFVGWFIGNSEFDFSTPVNSNINLSAKWTPKEYVVTFSDGVNAQTVKYGGTVVKPTNPTKSGYTFDGWLLEEEPFSFDTPITSNISLTAKWIVNTYTVTFSDGVRAQIVNHGSKATQPEDPVKTGHKFDGWLLEEEPFSFDTPITSNISLTAKWIIKTYTVTFSDGVEAQTIYYGSNATQPQNPEKSGYTFGGWLLNGELFKFTNPVTSDISLTAKWIIKTYTVTFSDGIRAQIVNHGSKATQPQNPVKDGYTFGGWLLEEEPFSFDTPITSNISLTAKWIIKTYTVTFSDGVEAQIVEHGKNATKPANPTKSGYRFGGWLLDGEAFSFSTPITADISLTAKWTMVIPDVSEYTVSFSDGVESQIIPEGATATKPVDPVKEGYTFAGWYLGNTEYDFSTHVNSNISLTAKWTIKTYTVSFTDGVKAQTVEHGKNATKPADPVKGDSKFSGWFLGDVAFDFSTPITSDISLTAKWDVVKFTVSFSDGIKSIQVEKGKTVAAPAEPTKDGYVFDGWFLGDVAFDFSTPITSDISLKANWIATHKVTFSDGMGSQIVKHGEKAENPGKPVKDGYRFDGWLLGDSKYSFGTKVTSDISLTAKWVKVDKPTIDISGENIDIQVNIDKNQAVIEVDSQKVVESIGKLTTDTTLKIQVDSEDDVINSIVVSHDFVAAVNGEVSKDNSKVNGVEFKFSGGKMTFNNEAFKSIVSQMGEGSAEFNIKDGFEALNDKQQNAMKEKFKGLTVETGFEVSIKVGDKTISDFGKGGFSKVQVPFDIPEGKHVAGYTVWYVADDGSMEKIESSYMDGEFTMDLPHYSDYVITYDESAVPDDSGNLMVILMVVLISTLLVIVIARMI